jgi:perosamine synthetase
MGTVGKVGSFSFSAPKVISTGQGGALITNDDDIAHNIRRLKDFGRSGGGNDIHDTIGYNFKFTDIQAVLGIEQMKKLPSRVDRKKEILLRYKDNLNNVNQVYFFEQNLEFTTPWFIDVFVEDREGLILHLKEKNIGSRMMYPPINKQKAYNVPGEYPVSNMIGVKGLWLPSASQLSDNQIDYICSKIKSFFSKSRN